MTRRRNTPSAPSQPVPWIGGGGIALMIAGVLVEARKGKLAQPGSLDAGTGVKTPRASDPVTEDDCAK